MMCYWSTKYDEIAWSKSINKKDTWSYQLKTEQSHTSACIHYDSHDGSSNRNLVATLD
uniref:Uncharacterized protein n=1 Tax=Arion vulgaris TaxID=1028688 RepID=A0A0B6ZBK5_9EUPU